METIQFQSVLPQVFAQRNDLDSEIWQQDVSFEKGHLILLKQTAERVRVLSAVMFWGIVTTIAEVCCLTRM